MESNLNPSNIVDIFKNIDFLKTDSSEDKLEDLNYEEQIKSFNIGPIPPGGRIHFSVLQFKAAKTTFDNDPSPLDGILLEKLRRKVPPKLEDLTSEERERLDSINFTAIQKHLKNLCHYWNQRPTQSLPFDIYEATVAEILAKSLAYLTHLPAGLEIKLPVRRGNEFKMVPYKIDASNHSSAIPSIGERLPCYLLSPPVNEHDLKPWLVIRGSETLATPDAVASKESLAADTVDLGGVSTAPIWEKISAFAKLAADSRKINIAGHSLGGTFAQTLGVLVAPFVDHCYAFNTPGVSKNTKELFDNLDPDDRKKFLVLQRQGDVASSSDPCLIGSNFEIEPQEQQASHITVHADLFLNQNFKLKTVDTVKENNNFLRKAVNFCRHLLFSKTFYIGQKLLWLKKRDNYQSFEEAYISWIKSFSLLASKIKNFEQFKRECALLPAEKQISYIEKELDSIRKLPISHSSSEYRKYEKALESLLPGG